ncbi:diguanylate cyclase [Solibacillus sp. MA9]|uniref:Diguanylate cyclase n=1 Tax=Solibacillus palustris TaxID=2908203 RepID=A0ABS9UDI7_9BACL|nr:GGDEF domain-containing protein [Solibacillus sp. MA9]MCH7322407.1 diguanylate cyclase [Solibacillus sp. MA9]
MTEYQQLVDQFKSEILSLCIDSKENLNNFNDYFSLLAHGLNKYFTIQDSILFRLKGNSLKPNYTDYQFLNELTLNDVQPLLKSHYIIEIPKIVQKQNYLQNHTHIMPLIVEQSILGLIVFKCEDETKEAYLTPQLVQEVTKIYQFLLDSYKMQANEDKYRKLYAITDLFHSTMDIDVILENVLVAIEENFANFEVELILSNDQDRQTRVCIKPFDYLSERPSTIESFVSGEMKEEKASELDCCLLNAPIKGRQAIYGILQVKAPLKYVFSTTEKEFIRMLAHASGNALENAKLYHQSHRLVSDLQLINETSHRMNMKLSINEMLLFLQKQLLKSFQPKEIGFFFKNENQYKSTEVCTGFFQHEEVQIYIEHIEKHFEVTQDSLFIADFSRLIDEDIPFKSIMAIPMIVEEKINGFSIVLHNEPYFFSFDSFKLMQSLIHHSSLAISNSILRDRLQEMVDRDHLTKLYARRFSDNYVEQSIQKDDSGMFLLIDIDNFKKVNDSFGHQVGDEVLVQISSQLQQQIGTRGICSRWGGEELAVYIPNILNNEALKIAQSIVDIVPNKTNPSVTVSAGLITWNRHARPDFQDIFLQADTALYSAKRNGKNRYCLFADSMQLQH